jgi:hypothetical protein
LILLKGDLIIKTFTFFSLEVSAGNTVSELDPTFNFFSGGAATPRIVAPTSNKILVTPLSTGWLDG